MTDEPSPRPWRIADIEHDYDILDADGKVAARAAHGNRELAALICAAVNEREAVRDALRDMEADAEAAWEGTPLRRILVKHVTAIREALAAALDHANECSRRAAAERARAVEEAQRDANMEADRLRDIVRRLLPIAETTVENIRALGTARFPFLEQIKSDRLRGDINREVANADHLLREARAAIGEGGAERRLNNSTQQQTKEGKEE